MLKSDCPCCSDTLLRHIRSGQVYWFCRQCHQAMPNYSAVPTALTINTKLSIESLLTKSSTYTQKALA